MHVPSIGCLCSARQSHRVDSAILGEASVRVAVPLELGHRRSCLLQSNCTPPQVKLAYQPVQITPIDLATGRLTITNEHQFTDPRGYTIRWSVIENASVVFSGQVPGEKLEAGPRQSTEVKLPYKLPTHPAPGAAYRLNVSVTLDEAAAWAGAGHVVARAQLDLPVGPAPVPGVSAATLPELELDRLADQLHASASRERLSVSDTATQTTASMGSFSASGWL